MNVDVVILAQIPFPDALSFSILGKRHHFPSHSETTKPQRRDSLAPSLAGAK